MPRGPKGRKCPADAVGHAAKVVRIAAGGEQEDFPADDGKDKAAQSLGRRARTDSLSSTHRKETARQAAKKMGKFVIHLT